MTALMQLMAGARMIWAQSRPGYRNGAEAARRCAEARGVYDDDNGIGIIGSDGRGAVDVCAAGTRAEAAWECADTVAAQEAQEGPEG